MESLLGLFMDKSNVLTKTEFVYNTFFIARGHAAVKSLEKQYGSLNMHHFPSLDLTSSLQRNKTLHILSIPSEFCKTHFETVSLNLMSIFFTFIVQYQFEWLDCYLTD